MKWVSRDIFSPGSRQEVNSTWYPEIEEPIKSREKHYSLVLYIPMTIILLLLTKNIGIQSASSNLNIQSALSECDRWTLNLFWDSEPWPTQPGLWRTHVCTDVFGALCRVPASLKPLLFLPVREKLGRTSSPVSRGQGLIVVRFPVGFVFEDSRLIWRLAQQRDTCFVDCSNSLADNSH